jgi:hypothetical protein
MDDDEHGYRGGVEVEAGAAARLASGNCAVGVRTSIGCTTNTMQDPIWSSKTTGNWDCKAAPIDIARHGHHTHKRAVSLGTIDPLWFGGAAGYLDLSSIQTAARNSGASGGRLMHPDGMCTTFHTTFTAWAQADSDIPNDPSLFPARRPSDHLQSPHIADRVQRQAGAIHWDRWRPSQSTPSQSLGLATSNSCT